MAVLMMYCIYFATPWKECYISALDVITLTLCIFKEVLYLEVYGQTEAHVITAPITGVINTCLLTR